MDILWLSATDRWQEERTLKVSRPTRVQRTRITPSACQGSGLTTHIIVHRSYRHRTHHTYHGKLVGAQVMNPLAKYTGLPAFRASTTANGLNAQILRFMVGAFHTYDGEGRQLTLQAVDAQRFHERKTHDWNAAITPTAPGFVAQGGRF